MQILPQSNFRIYTSPQTFKRRRLCKGINRRKRELLGVTLGSIWGFPDGLDCKESACNVEDLGSIPGSGRYLGGGNCYSFQYSCLENSMDRGVWQATVHGVPKRRKWLSVCARAHTHTHTHTPISWLIHFQTQDPVSKTPVKNVCGGLKIMGMVGRSSSMILRRQNQGQQIEVPTWWILDLQTKLNLQIMFYT